LPLALEAMAGLEYGREVDHKWSKKFAVLFSACATWSREIAGGRRQMRKGMAAGWWCAQRRVSLVARREIELESR
jgi:hypothetical protein